MFIQQEENKDKYNHHYLQVDDVMKLKDQPYASLGQTEQQAASSELAQAEIKAEPESVWGSNWHSIEFSI